jgi:hypothetical protein
LMKFVWKPSLWLLLFLWEVDGLEWGEVAVDDDDDDANLSTTLKW